MTRSLRIELRRSNALGVALLLVVICGLVIAGMRDFWWGQWLRFGYAQTTTMFVLTPLALAGGVMLGRRDRRTRAEELMNSTGRPRWQRAFPPMGALGLGVLAAHAAILGVGLTSAVVTGGYLNLRGAAAPLVDALVLVGAAWLGVAVGRRWASALLPPALAAVVLVVQFAVQSVPDDNPLKNLSLMITYPPDAPWETVSTPALLSRLALAAGLIAAGLLLAGGHSWVRRGGAVASVAAGMAGLLLITTSAASGRWQIDPDAQRLVCADGTPQVCVTAVHAHLLPTIAPEARRALAALAKLPGAPTRAVEVRLPHLGRGDSEQWQLVKPQPGTAQFAVEVDPETGTDPDITASIALGGGTFYGGCGSFSGNAMEVVGAWLLGTDDVQLWIPGFGYISSDQRTRDIRERVTKLRALPADEQLRRVVAVRDAAARCEPDLDAVLDVEADS